MSLCPKERSPNKGVVALAQLIKQHLALLLVCLGNLHTGGRGAGGPAPPGGGGGGGGRGRGGGAGGVVGGGVGGTFGRGAAGGGEGLR